MQAAIRDNAILRDTRIVLLKLLRHLCDNKSKRTRGYRIFDVSARKQ